MREEKVFYSLLGHYSINLLAGILWFIFAYSNIQPGLKLLEFDFQAFLYLSLFFRNSSVTILFLIRRPSKEKSRAFKEWFWGFCGTFSGFFYTQKGTYPIIPSSQQSIVLVVLIFATILSMLAIWSLGRSFGIVPANRGIQSRGLYSAVRHPIYASYIFFDIMFLSISFSLINLSIFFVSSVALYLRAIYEERLLLRDPAYWHYAKKTRYMFFPRFF